MENGLQEHRIAAELLPYLPNDLRSIFNRFSAADWAKMEEIRLRVFQPTIIRTHEGDFFINAKGSLAKDSDNAIYCTYAQVRQAVLLLSESSYYAFEEEIRRGYLTLKGGHRAGFSGKAVLDRGMIQTLKDISSINLRIAHHIPDTAREVLPYLFEDGMFCNTLIISPPGAGKTTLLRNIAYELSQGVHCLPNTVSIVDERSEIAAMVYGIPQLPVGMRTDVLDGCPKAEGIMLMIRSMSPQVIVCDEIGRSEDAYAIREAVNAGVKMVVSAHAKNYEELKERPVMAEILQSGCFKRVVTLSRSNGPGSVEDIQTETLQSIFHPRLLRKRG